MTLLKRVILFLVILIVLLVAVSFFLPAQTHVERSIVVDADQERVFDTVNNIRTFNEWSPWADLDPETRFSYSGPDSGVGAKMAWQSDKQEVGSGSMEITDTEPHRRVDMELDFGSQGTAESFLFLERVDGGTRVTWGFDTEHGYDPLARYFGLMMDRFIGPPYEQGLADLKQLVESAPEPEADEPGEDRNIPDIEVMEVEPMQILFATGSSSQEPETIGPALAEAYGKVMTVIAEQGLEQQGAPLSIATRWEDNVYEFKAAIPIRAMEEISVASDSEVQMGTTYTGRVVRAVHTGSYEQLTDTYEAIEEFIEARNLSVNGHSWEHYVSDPGNTAEADRVTHIYYPVK